MECEREAVGFVVEVYTCICVGFRALGHICLGGTESMEKILETNLLFGVCIAVTAGNP